MSARSKVALWRQAITGDDNKTLDPAFLPVMFAVFLVLPAVITLMIILAGIDVIVNKHEASIGALGGGIAAVIAAVGAFIASCAVILRQDRTTTSPGSTEPKVGMVGMVGDPPKEKVDIAIAAMKG